MLGRLLLATDLFLLHTAVEVALVSGQMIDYQHYPLESEEVHNELEYQSVAVAVTVAEEGGGGMDHRPGCNLW